MLQVRCDGTVVEEEGDGEGYEVEGQSYRCSCITNCLLCNPILFIRLSQKWFVTKGQTGDEQRLWTIPVTVVFPSGMFGPSSIKTAAQIVGWK